MTDFGDLLYQHLFAKIRFFFFLAYNQKDYTPQPVILGGQAAPETDDAEE